MAAQDLCLASLPNDELVEILRHVRDAYALANVCQTCRYFRDFLSRPEIKDIWQRAGVQSFHGLDNIFQSTKLPNDDIRSYQDIVKDVGWAHAVYFALFPEAKRNPAEPWWCPSLPATPKYVLRRLISQAMRPKIRPWLERVLYAGSNVENPRHIVMLWSSAVLWGDDSSPEDEYLGSLWDLRRAILGVYWLGIDVHPAAHVMGLALALADEEVARPLFRSIFSALSGSETDEEAASASAVTRKPLKMLVLEFPLMMEMRFGGGSLLGLACIGGRLSLMKMVLDEGADVDGTGERGTLVALMLAQKHEDAGHGYPRQGYALDYDSNDEAEDDREDGGDTDDDDDEGESEQSYDVDVERALDGEMGGVDGMVVMDDMDDMDGVYSVDDEDGVANFIVEDQEGVENRIVETTEEVEAGNMIGVTDSEPVDCRTVPETELEEGQVEIENKEKDPTIPGSRQGSLEDDAEFGQFQQEVAEEGETSRGESEMSKIEVCIAASGTEASRAQDRDVDLNERVSPSTEEGEHCASRHTSRRPEDRTREESPSESSSVPQADFFVDTVVNNNNDNLSNADGVPSPGDHSLGRMHGEFKVESGIAQAQSNCSTENDPGSSCTWKLKSASETIASSDDEMRSSEPQSDERKRFRWTRHTIGPRFAFLDDADLELQMQGTCNYGSDWGRVLRPAYLTPLQLAILHRRPAAVRELLQAGACHTVRGSWFRPLHMACMSTWHRLPHLPASASLTPTDPLEMRPLGLPPQRAPPSVSQQRKSLKIVKMLLRKGASLEGDYNSWPAPPRELEMPSECLNCEAGIVPELHEELRDLLDSVLNPQKGESENGLFDLD